MGQWIEENLDKNHKVPDAADSPPPDDTSPMLARLTDDYFDDPDWIFERKLDGERVLVFCTDDVEFTEWTDDGKLRHPRFEGLRDDKEARDVVREPR